MANVVATQLLLDGPRNAQIKITGSINTANITSQVIVTPSSLSSMIPGWSGNEPPVTVAVKNIDYSIADGLTLQLNWDGATPAVIDELYGRGNVDYTKWGFQQNNATTPTGSISLTSFGWTTGQVLNFTLTLWLIKQGPFA